MSDIRKAIKINLMVDLTLDTEIVLAAEHKMFISCRGENEDEKGWKGIEMGKGTTCDREMSS